MDKAQHSTHQETIHLTAHLDELERKLFAVGQLSFKSYKVLSYRYSFQLTDFPSKRNI